jgi:hypothetical protein
VPSDQEVVPDDEHLAGGPAGSLQPVEKILHGGAVVNENNMKAGILLRGSVPGWESLHHPGCDIHLARIVHLLGTPGRGRKEKSSHEIVQVPGRDCFENTSRNGQ